MTPSPIAYSVVIPLFNEEETLPELYHRLTAVMERLGAPYEIVFVDDGSRDDSPAALKTLHARDPRVKVLTFSRNFGHHKALTAGIDYAHGQAVVLMDADLQDQPEEIPKLLAKFHEGYDVVHGVRQHRKDALTKRFSSQVFVTVMNQMIGSGQPINSEIFRVMSRQVVEEFKRCREVSRFITGLVSWLGFRQIGVPVEHGVRYAGTSKYSFWKLIRLALNTVTSFSYFPLQLATYVGLTAAALSILMAGYVVWRWLAIGIPVPGYASIMVLILLLGGTQLIILGIMGEYVGRVYSEVQARPLYVVRQILE